MIFMMCKAQASSCQVHRARLLSGEDVAVKLQYSGLESAVAADLATFSALATLAGLAFPDVQLVGAPSAGLSHPRTRVECCYSEGPPSSQAEWQR